MQVVAVEDALGGGDSGQRNRLGHAARADPLTRSPIHKMCGNRLVGFTRGVTWYAATDPTEAALGEDLLREIGWELQAAYVAGTFHDYRAAFAHYRRAWDLATTRA